MLHPCILLPPAWIGRLCHLDDTADLDDGLALSDQLLNGLEQANDLLHPVLVALHDEVLGSVWPAEDSHSPWTAFQDPRHETFESAVLFFQLILFPSLVGLRVLAVQPSAE